MTITTAGKECKRQQQAEGFHCHCLTSHNMEVPGPCPHWFVTKRKNTKRKTSES